ncbi:glutathione synthetase [Cohaesibacter intestini]|uniref:glutathione synthetase n=1 Tax=Cohaesibacter intestini TaxID=2211145 RepID=UPI0018E574FA|nr:glutathione synthetase [Cohaesibacter intestini]
MTTLSRPMKICFLMYPWEQIEPETDTTLRLIFEAWQRGHIVTMATQTSLTLRDTEAYGFCQVIRCNGTPKTAVHFYKQAVLTKKMLPLAGFDTIFMRANPPLDPTVLNFLDAVKEDVFICNDVNGLRLASSKIYTASLYDPANNFVPVTHVSKNRDYLERVLAESEGDRMILKPLRGYGGQGVIIVEKGSRASFRSLLDFYLGASNDQYVILQEFVPGAEQGDVRVMMLNGEPIGAMRRVPADGDLRSNIHQGGKAVKHVLNKEEKALCKHIGHKLVRDGLFFVGLDIIGGKLIEVNVLSPGGIVRINKLNRTRLQVKVIDFVESVIATREVLMARRSQYQRLIEDAVTES